MSKQQATELQKKLIQSLEQHGASTSRQLADRLDLSVKQVSNSLSFARGEGRVNDGSVEYVWPQGNGCVHRPDGVIVWTLGKHTKIEGDCPERAS